MDYSKRAREIGTRRKLVTAGSLAGILFLIGADCVPSERKLAMAKIAADETGKARRGSTVPPARDPSIAVAEEYQLARRQGTAEALKLFIARHGDDPLAAKARADLQRLSR
jgi:hypothetical protein